MKSKTSYPNHYTMKKNRLIKLKQHKGKCEICGKRAKCIHHIDSSKDNHKLNNLAILCSKCHGVIHAGRKNGKERLSRIKILYGMSINEMIEKFGRSSSVYYSWHHKGILETYLKNPTLIFPPFKTKIKKNNIKIKVYNPKGERLSRYKKEYGLYWYEIKEKLGITRGASEIELLRKHHNGTLKKEIEEYEKSI